MPPHQIEKFNQCNDSIQIEGYKKCQVIIDNFKVRFGDNFGGTFDNTSDWVGIRGNGYLAFTNIMFGSTSIGRVLQLGRAVEGVALTYATGGASPNWGGVINAAGFAIGGPSQTLSNGR